jgi:hypothetical protein
MRVTFPRLPDHEKAYAVIERDDGVVYRLYGGVAGTALPHDVRHLVVERALGIRDGLWGEIASGRRQFRATGLRAEMMAELAERVAGLSAPTPAQIRCLASTVLSVLPDGGADVDAEAIADAARALQVEASRWARLRPGEQLVYDWPAPPRIPRQRRP